MKPLKMRSILPMQIAKYGYVLLSVFISVIGFATMFHPEVSEKIMVRALGIVLLVFGIIKLVGYFSKDLYRLAFQFDLQFGILLVILGLILVMDPKGTVSLLMMAFGIVILLDGLFKGQISLEAKRFGIKTWWTTMGTAILACLIGAFLILKSTTGSKLLFILLGLGLFIEGLLNLSTALSTVKIVRHQKPDIIDAEYVEVEERL